MTTLTTYLRRKSYGDKSWGAKTTENFEINGRTAQLEVFTYKGERGLLVTCASIGFVKGEIVTTTIFADYFRRFETCAVRCTEKAVSEQQARTVAKWDDIKAAVLAFYANPVVR